MRRSVTKIRNIQEMNRMLEKRMLKESNYLNKKTLISENPVTPLTDSDIESFSPDEFVGMGSKSGTYEIYNGMLLLKPSIDFDDLKGYKFHITCR